MCTNCLFVATKAPFHGEVLAILPIHDHPRGLVLALHLAAADEHRNERHCVVLEHHAIRRSVVLQLPHEHVSVEEEHVGRLPRLREDDRILRHLHAHAPVDSRNGGALLRARETHVQRETLPKHGITTTEEGSEEEARRKNDASHALEGAVRESAGIDESPRIVADALFDHAVLENAFLVENTVLIELAFATVSAIHELALVDNTTRGDVHNRSVAVRLAVEHISRVQQLGANAIRARRLGGRVYVAHLQLGSPNVRAGTVRPVVRFRSALS